MREVLEANEKATLAPYASLSADSRGRRFPETEDRYRSAFQRDRDRVIYTSAFKNLQFKTQVFVVHEGDYYRTRLTHTLEVMQHARTFARVIRVNEDLVEAIALAHDLGHTPFGHAGEEILAELLKSNGGFDHNLHSLRVVDELEERYPEFPGLNLTFETREGIARHLTRFDQPNFPDEFKGLPQPGVEAQIVNVADSLAFASHDIDDALRVGLLTWEDLLDLEIPAVQEATARITSEEVKDGRFSAQMRNNRLVRHLIYHFNEDCILATGKRLEKLGGAAPDDLRRLKEPVVGLSAAGRKELDCLISFLFDQVYKNPMVLMMGEKGKMILRRLFERFWEQPQLLPSAVWRRSGKMKGENTKAHLIGDYLAGLTDRQAMDIYEMMFEPYTKVMGYGFGK